MTTSFILTHSGKFHADDVFAVAVLKLLPEFVAIDVIRSRDPFYVKNATIAVDVGFEHDPVRRRFDHHQAGAPKAPDGRPYSAFGLIWDAYGAACVARCAGAPEDEDAIQAAFRIGESFVASIDRTDNGVGTVGPADVSIAIDAMNADDPNDESQQSLAFFNALAFAKSVVTGMARVAHKERSDFKRTASHWNDDAVAASGGVLELPAKIEWADFVVTANNNHIAAFAVPAALFVLQPRADGQWGMTATPVAKGSFVCHRLIAENLRGRKPDEILSLTGIHNIGFVHANGFYACGSREAMLSLARLSETDARAA